MSIGADYIYEIFNALHQSDLNPPTPTMLKVWQWNAVVLLTFYSFLISTRNKINIFLDNPLK